MLAAAAKIALPPDDYYADAFLRAALHFFDLEIFKVGVVLVLLAAVIAYGAILALLSIWLPRGACICALGIVLGLLSIYWLHFDHSVHASSRYYLRTALVIATPLLGAMAAIAAMTREGIVLDRLARLRHALISPRGGTLCALAAIFLVVTLIHAIETGKFVASWVEYRDAIAVLAMSSKSDPALGDPRFVSAERISPALAPLSWFSTIPYLSIILSNFTPNRLVIDPAGNYFWLSCANGNEEQGCGACRSGADPRIGPGLFVPASISRARCRLTAPKSPLHLLERLALKLIIFDFDGTLVDSRSLILESHRIVFADFQLPAPSPADSLALVGKSLDVILTQLAGPTAPILEMVRAYDLLLPQLRADPAFAEKPFDGVGRPSA